MSRFFKKQVKIGVSEMVEDLEGNFGKKLDNMFIVLGEVSDGIEKEYVDTENADNKKGGFRWRLSTRQSNPRLQRA